METLHKTIDTLVWNLGGGPKVLPFRYIINTFKGLTPVTMLFLIYYY